MGRVSCSEFIKAGPAQVWAVLTDVPRLPAWAYREGRFPHLVEAKYGGEQKESVGATWIGVSVDGQTATQKITAWEPARKLAYELQAMEHAALQASQTNTFELQAEGDGTQLTWNVDWQLPRGFSLAALLMRFTANRAFEEMMAGSLGNLKQLIETETAAGVTA
ncbi:MAG: SRPBCC family protein [Chloroflexota bacterium]